MGTAVIQLSKIARSHVIGLTSSKQKAARVSDLGLEYVFTYDRPTVVEDG